MNIRGLKTLIGNLPDEVTSEQLDMIKIDIADIEAKADAETKNELDEALARVAALQAKLRCPVKISMEQAPLQIQQPPADAPLLTRRRAQRGEDFTDADLGIGDDDDESADGPELTMGQFQAELRTARASGVAKRRNLS